MREAEAMARTHEQTRANYERLSRWYDLLSGGPERALREAGFRALAVKPGERVLELGAGTGAALVELARTAGPGGLAVGVDLSLGMCREAKLRIADCGPAKSARDSLRIESALGAAIICGDATRTPLAGGAFDGVFMSFSLELFEEGEMRAVLAECRRVLKFGGRLSVVAMAESARPSPMTRLYAWAHDHYPGTVDCRPIDVGQVLAQGGFRIGHMERRSLWGLPVEIAVCHPRA